MLLLIYESFGTEESPCAHSESKNAKLKVPMEVWNEHLQERVRLLTGQPHPPTLRNAFSARMHTSRTTNHDYWP